MSLFDDVFGPLFGRKPPEPKTIAFSTWEDTESPAEAPSPAAAWPFPSATNPPPRAPETAEEAAPELIVNTTKLAEFHAAEALKRRTEKARLKQIVQAAPEYGIEFVHVGETTFAWRYHTAPEEGGYVRHPRVIDISTAICNPSDQFAKWHGSAVAAQNMINGSFITFRVGSEYESPREALLIMGTASLSINDALDHVGGLFRD